MISESLRKKLLEQVRHEWESEFLYMSMMAWCMNNDYNGFANWFFQQSAEERIHGQKILSFIAEVGGDISIPSVTVPPIEFTGLEQCFQVQYEHEQKVTKLIHQCVEQAIAEHDHSTNIFLQWFVREQIEEESTARTLLAKVRRCEGAPGALLILENELSSRGPGLPAALEEDQPGEK